MAATAPRHENPCVLRDGPGPEGTHCGTCAELRATRVATAPLGGRDPAPAEQTLYYCARSGEAKRVTWPACANYVAA